MQNLRTCRRLATATLAVAGLTLAAATANTAAVASAHTGPSWHPRTVSPRTRLACRITKSPQTAACMALIRTDIKQRLEAFFRGKPPTGFGYGRSDLVRAYKLGSSNALRTVAVVDAYNDPNAASDLATYRAAWGLPKCNHMTMAGCLFVTNQFGLSIPLPQNMKSSGWATEESLDVDMVSAICPDCRILLVEANSPSIKNLGTAVNAAVKLGVRYVSNSYGTPESRAELGYDTKYYKHAGVAVTAAAGISGYGVSYPAASRWVTAVGGTTLTKRDDTRRGWTEAIWGGRAGGQGTGSGCSRFERRPVVQTGKGWPIFKRCKNRIDNDVSAVANPRTGVAIYDTYDQHGWLEVGGTGVSSPIIAAVFALAGVPAGGTFPSRYLYFDHKELNDITKGRNGACGLTFLCKGMTGFDAPSGCGSPSGLSAFRPSMSGPPCVVLPPHW